MTTYKQYEDPVELIQEWIFCKNPRFCGFDPTTGNGFIMSDNSSWCYSKDLPKIIQWGFKRKK